MELPAGSLELGRPGRGCLVFLPGFLSPPHAYRTLLEPVAAHLGRVVVPAVAGSLPAAATGRSTPAAEAARATSIVSRLTSSGSEVWLGGHSRGGLVSWVAAGSAEVRGLVLVDPVGGGGPPWTTPPPLPPLATSSPVLVVGLALGGRCAPRDRNHDVFAAAAPGCRHTVLEGCGHADVLDGRFGRLGRVVCGGGSDHRRATGTVTAEIVRFLDEHATPPTTTG